MNFSGRSVRLASRVIEIDEVFEVRIVFGPQMRHQVFEDRDLHRLAFGRRLDDQVASGPDRSASIVVLIRFSAAA